MAAHFALLTALGESGQSSNWPDNRHLRLPSARPLPSSLLRVISPPPPSPVYPEPATVHPNRSPARQAIVDGRERSTTCIRMEPQVDSPKLTGLCCTRAVDEAPRRHERINGDQGRQQPAKPSPQQARSLRHARIGPNPSPKGGAKAVNALLEAMRDPTIAVIVGAVIGVVGTILVALINRRSEWAQARRRRKKAKHKAALQSVCPHTEIVVNGTQIVLEPLWWKTPGTWIYSCRLCGGQCDQRGAEWNAEIWAKMEASQLLETLVPRIERARRARRKYDEAIED